jgi:hypothetical protein
MLNSIQFKNHHLRKLRNVTTDGSQKSIEFEGQRNDGGNFLIENEGETLSY